MKVKCSGCNRLVGVSRGEVAGIKGMILSKHRTGRSRPKRVKKICANSGRVAA